MSFEEVNNMIDWTEDPRAEVFEFNKEGDVIEGELIQIKEITIGDRIAKLAILKDDLEAESGIWLSSVLEREFEEQAISPGDYVGVKFLGMKKGKKYTYKNFDVRVVLKEE